MAWWLGGGPYMERQKEWSVGRTDGPGREDLGEAQIGTVKLGG